MKEYLEVYDLNKNFIGIEEREKYYQKIWREYKNKRKITTQIKSIRLLLMNSEGRIILQRRGRTKQDNQGLYDKTIGGHVKKGDTFNLTLIKECAEELGFPVSVLPAEEFNKALKKTNLRIVGLFKAIDERSNYQSTRVMSNGKKITQPFYAVTYVGYYDGRIQFIDGESSGVEVLSLKELQKEIRKYPNKFTEDLKYMIKKYKKYLKPIK